MNAEQKVKYLIVARACEWAGDELPDFASITSDQVEAEYRDLVDKEEHWDATNEVRGGDIETDIKCDWSRHYEAKSVAAKLPDGSWVGWTYWYGGGKHAEPEAIDWIDTAYDLNCVEEEKLVVVRSFSKAETVAGLSPGAGV